MDVVSLCLLAEWRDCVYGIRKHYQAHWWSRIIGRSAKDHRGHRPGPSGRRTSKTMSGQEFAVYSRRTVARCCVETDSVMALSLLWYSNYDERQSFGMFFFCPAIVVRAAAGISLNWNFAASLYNRNIGSNLAILQDLCTS